MRLRVTLLSTSHEKTGEQRPLERAKEGFPARLRSNGEFEPTTILQVPGLDVGDWLKLCQRIVLVERDAEGLAVPNTGWYTSPVKDWSKDSRGRWTVTTEHSTYLVELAPAK